jgi:hypothetical protein
MCARAGRAALAAVLQSAVPAAGSGALGDGAYRVARPPRHLAEYRMSTKTMAETLTIPTTDGQAVRSADHRRHHSRHDLKKIKTDDPTTRAGTYDPAFMNTAACRSRITTSTATRASCSIADTHRAAGRESTYLETAYLILFGELPNQRS